MGLFNEEWIPILAGRRLEDFSPEEFKSHVRGLKIEPPPKKIRAIKLKKHIVWKLSPKKKSLSLKINRDPKWITREEIAKVARESGIEERLVWVKVAATKATVVSNEEQGHELNKQLKEIPF